MNSKTNAVNTKEYLISVLVSNNWKGDRWGNYKKTIKKRHKLTGRLIEKLYRFKLQAKSVRLEVQSNIEGGKYSEDRNEWFKIDGCYYKDLRVEDNKLYIGKMSLEVK